VSTADLAHRFSQPPDSETSKVEWRYRRGQLARMSDRFKLAAWSNMTLADVPEATSVDDGEETSSMFGH